MPANPKAPMPALRTEILLVAVLIGLCVAARLLPHALNFSPVAASALFAGAILRHRMLALMVPLAAMLVSDLVIGFDEWRIALVVYVSMVVPVGAGILARRFRLSRSVLPAMLGSSLVFFVTTNFAVWAFGGLYPHDLAGLVQCYIAGLPFLKHTIAGDLFWSLALFGGAWLLRRSRPDAAFAVRT